MADSLKYTVEQYGSHELQRVGVWTLDLALDLADQAKTKYWIVYQLTILHEYLVWVPSTNT